MTSASTLPARQVDPCRAGARRCSRPGCEDAHYALGRCKRHYSKVRAVRRAQGVHAPVAAAPVARHIGLLRARGWTWGAIAERARSSAPVAKSVHAGELATLPREKAARYLAVPATWQRTRVSVSILGTRRRLDSLAWQGWSARAVSARLGLSEYTFPNTNRTGNIEARTAALVADFYERHAYRPGPDPVYAKAARTGGAIPPGAWDDNLDDPDAQPVLGRHELAAARAATVARLTAAGSSLDVIAARVGMHRRSVRRLQGRAS